MTAATRAKKYRINAGRVEVIDAFNKFASDNVEDVLRELKDNITQSQGGFSILVNETPHKDFDFFQDPNLKIFRSSEEIDVIYNHTEGTERIEHTSGSTVEIQTSSFAVPNLIKSPYIETTVLFPNSTGIFNLIFNKNGGSYYKIKAGWGNGLRLYRAIDDIETLIYHYSTVLFNNPSQEYKIELRKIEEAMDVRVNGIRYLRKSDGVLDNIGSVELAPETNLASKKLYMKYIKFGQLTQSA